METTYLTAGYRGLVQKLRKAKTGKSRGVKASGSGGDKPGSVSGKGIRRGAVHLLPPPKQDIRLPAETSESLDTEEESDGGVQPPSYSPRGSKSDQFALSPVTPPQELSTPGDITTTVTDNPVLTQDSSPVLDSARPSSSTPVKQEGTAAQPLQVSADVLLKHTQQRDICIN